MPPENEQRPGQGASRSSWGTGEPMSEPIVGDAAPLQQRARLLRSKDAARYIGVGTRTLWTLTNLRRIPAVRFNTGGRESVRYDRDDLDRWIEAHKAEERIGGAL